MASSSSNYQPLLLSSEAFILNYTDNFFIFSVGQHKYVYIVEMISRFNKCIKNWHIKLMNQVPVV